MKSVIGKAGVVAAALVLCGSGRAMASEMEVNIPFAFMVQQQSMPAGAYRVVRETDDPSVVMIRGEKGNKASMVAMTRPAPGHDPAGNKPSLTFKRVENQYQLSDIWDSGTAGQEIVGR